MNFQALEWLINSIISSYTCDSCQSKAHKHDLEIQNIEGNAVTISIKCPNCQTTSYIKSEVVSVDLTKYLSPEQLEMVKTSITEQDTASISDQEIVEIHKLLNQKECNVQDFLTD